MRGFGIDRILAGTAVALVLAATDGRAIAAPEPAAAVETDAASAAAETSTKTSADPAIQPAAKSDGSGQPEATPTVAAPVEPPSAASAASEPASATPIADGSATKPPADSATSSIPAASETSPAAATASDTGSKSTETSTEKATKAATPADADDATTASTSTESPAAIAPVTTSEQPAGSTEPAKETAKAPPSDQPVAAPSETAKATPPEQPAANAESKSAPESEAAPKSDTASAPAAAPATTVGDRDSSFANLAAADAQIAEKLRDIVTGNLSRTFRDKDERSAVEAFYMARGFAPLWIENGIESARAKALSVRLKASDADGLDPTDYKLPDFAAKEPDAQADAELKMTAVLLTFARHLQAGRVEISRISTNILMPQTPPDPSKVLASIAEAADTGKALDAFSPPQPGYKALKAKLAELRKQSATKDIVRIPDGPTLRPGMDDPRVALLRQRLDIDGDKTSTNYDDAVLEAVKKFQRNAGLGTDGMAGPNTLRALNSPRKADRIEVIVANMERWRWMPRDLGQSHVILNIPDYTLKVFKNDAVLWRTKVVVGKPTTPTPILTETIKFITVNPTWNVPPSIIYGEYLPAMQQDPTVLDRMGLKVVNNRDGSVHIYQPPGDRNALGRIRFNFPNKFLVYQHDTPDKHLFKHDRRAYSHGCMRVEDPLKYGEVLLSIALPGKKYTAAGLRRLYGNSEHNISFPKPIPVHVTYQTAFVDESGELVVRPDIYGFDQRVVAGIKNDGRIDYASAERRRQAAERQRQREIRSSNARSYQPSGLSFFERLFQ